MKCYVCGRSDSHTFGQGMLFGIILGLLSGIVCLQVIPKLIQ